MDAVPSTSPESPSSKAPQMCDVCGRDVPEGTGVRSEVSVAGAMCPTPMSFHEECFEQASKMWTPDPDSYCLVDDRFPESQRWDKLQAEADKAEAAS